MLISQVALKDKKMLLAFLTLREAKLSVQERRFANATVFSMEKSPWVGSAEFVSRAAVASVNTPLVASWLKIFLNLQIF